MEKFVKDNEIKLGEIYLMRSLKFTFSLAISFLMLAAVISAQPGSSSTIRLQPVVSGLSAPLLATNAKDGSKRLFIVQQGGIIKVVQPGASTATDFMNITPRVLSGGERGLLGLAFHPQFAANGYFFVNYTRQTDGATIIARFKTTDSTNTLGDPASERILLTIPQPFSNHNGGMIEFRNDNGANNLYIGMGDGGSANDPGNRAQNINELLGKFLRITPDVSGNATAPAYTVPADNPFVGVAGADEIYAVGLRNPFRWSFDRGGTRQLWAGDVGQGSIEEVDVITRGGNYGWRVYEGTQCTNLNPTACIPANFIPPVFQYSSSGSSSRCSVTGGYVYRGNQATLPLGTYIYGDYCTGEVLMWDGTQQLPLLNTGNDLPSFGEDEDGELYVCSLSAGTVRRIARVKANSDFDGDGKTDFSVFRPSNGVWYILSTFTNSYYGQAFGASGDVPTPSDYDGDGKTDIGVFRRTGPQGAVWYYMQSSDNTFRGFQWGASSDTPVPGDYDGDGKTDIAVFRNGANTAGSGFNVYYIVNSGNGAITTVPVQGCCDAPVPADYDGDGKTDIAIWQAATGVWQIRNSSNNLTTNTQFGIFSGGNNNDITTPGDFDGDKKIDIAVFRPSTGVWYIRRSSNGSVEGVQFGANGDFPVVGDYDGDERDDIAVWRPSNGVWYALQSSNNQLKAAQFGANGDLPAPYYDVP